MPRVCVSLIPGPHVREVDVSRSVFIEARQEKYIPFGLAHSSRIYDQDLTPAEAYADGAWRGADFVVTMPEPIEAASYTRMGESHGGSVERTWPKRTLDPGQGVGYGGS